MCVCGGGGEGVAQNIYITNILVSLCEYFCVWGGGGWGVCVLCVLSCFKVSS